MWEKTQPSRREFLARAGNGFGIVAPGDLLGSQTSLAAPPDLDRAANPYAVRVPHHAAACRRCLFLYMPGGPSHIDLFDPKPRVAAMNGQPLPFAKPRLERAKTGNLLASPWKFKKHGECGTEISELLPHLAAHADDLCVIRSMVADNINHTGAALQMNTGEQAFSGQASARGSYTASGPKTKICQLLWWSARPPSSKEPSSGARAFCRARTRELLSAISAIRLRTCPTPPATPSTSASSPQSASLITCTSATACSTASSTHASRRSS